MKNIQEEEEQVQLQQINEEVPQVQNVAVKASDLKRRKKNKIFSSYSLKNSNGRNMSKYIIKMFFHLIRECQFDPDHWIALMEIKKRAKDTGNTKHLKQLFGKGLTDQQIKRNQKNRKICQDLISTKFAKEIVQSNSIKDPVNYICTCFCYMYRLNYSSTAASGVALMRK